MRRIVIGFDGSEHGADGLALGLLLAEATGAQPLVAAVLPPPERLLGADEEEEAVEARAEELFAIARARLDGLEVETVLLREASPGQALHDLAEREQPLLVVLGSSHRGGVGRVLLGSTGDALLAGAPCAVAVAPSGFAAEEHPTLLRTGVAVNGSDESWPALRTAAGLAGRLHATLTVLAVTEPPNYGYGAAYSVLSGAGFHDIAHGRMERILDRAGEQVPAGQPLEKRLMTGDPAEVIAEAAEELDLLVVGSRGYGPIKRVLLGGVSTKLMRTSPCPILILPRDAGDDPLGLDPDR